MADRIDSEEFVVITKTNDLIFWFTPCGEAAFI